jgi:hypothetical protein
MNPTCFKYGQNCSSKHSQRSHPLMAKNFCLIYCLFDCSWILFEHLSIFATFYLVFYLCFKVIFGVAAGITAVISGGHPLQNKLFTRFWLYHGSKIVASCSKFKVGLGFSAMYFVDSLIISYSFFRFSWGIQKWCEIGVKCSFSYQLVINSITLNLAL